jgi:hypothetical protein
MLAMMARCLLAIVLLFSATAGQAQEIQWVGDLCSTTVLPKMHGNYTLTLLIDEDDAIHGKVPSLKEHRGFPRPMEQVGIQGSHFWRGGVMHQIAECLPIAKGGGRSIRPWAFAKWEDGGWRSLGTFEPDVLDGLDGPDGRDLLEAIPCDGVRFIVISCNRDLAGDRGPGRSPFHVASFPEGSDRLRLDSRIDHGQDELRPHMLGDECFSLAWLSHKAATDSHAVLVNSRTGLYWVFSLEKASLVRAGNVFKKVTTEMIADGGFPEAVLCVNPEKAGTVLVEAQDEDYFIAENGDYCREWNELSLRNPDMPTKELDRLMAPREKQLRENSPHIVWYRIHPESGRAERLHEPPEGGSRLRGGWKDEVFRPMPDGSVKMGWGAGKLYERLGIDIEKEMEKEMERVMAKTPAPPHPGEVDAEPGAGDDSAPEPSGADGCADGCGDNGKDGGKGGV